MNKMIVIPILVGIVIAVSAFLLLSNDISSDPESPLVYGSGFTYYDIRKSKII